MVDATRESPYRPSRLIVVEGIDGSGACEQVWRMADHLRLRGESVFVSNEPSDGPVGMLIRLAFARRLSGPHNESGTALDPYTLALLFAADRADHVAAQLRPRLTRGYHVLCHHYILSTLAYQGRTCDLDWLLTINMNIIRPDLTIFLDVPPGKALKPMKCTHSGFLDESPYEQLGIRNQYIELLRREIPVVGPVVVIDASRPAAEVGADVVSTLDTFLNTGKVDTAFGELTLL